MEKYKIKTATACYTGGGIYIYWGQLEDGRHFRSVDDWEIVWILDTYAGLDNEDADYDEFYETHTLEELRGPDFVAFWNYMLKHILEHDKQGNYCLNEMSARFIRPVEPPTFDELQNRISEALENELARIYDELNIERGDITPTQSLEWDEATAKITYLFRDLIAQNK